MDIKPQSKTSTHASTPPEKPEHTPGVDAMPAGHIAPTKGRKSLAIALVTATVFLLAALAVAAWLFVSKQQNTAPNTVTSADPSDPANVKKVTWVAPVDMPAAYAWSSQDADAEHLATYYTDATSGCYVVSRVLPAADDNEALATLAGDTEGIKTTTTTSGDSKVSIFDADGERQYTFSVVEADQKVSVPGVDFDKQSGVIYYLQFGEQLASVGFTCKLASLGTKSDELNALVKQFKVKTEL